MFVRSGTLWRDRSPRAQDMAPTFPIKPGSVARFRCRWRQPESAVCPHLVWHRANPATKNWSRYREEESLLRLLCSYVEEWILPARLTDLSATSQAMLRGIRSRARLTDWLRRTRMWPFRLPRTYGCAWPKDLGGCDAAASIRRRKDVRGQHDSGCELSS